MLAPIEPAMLARAHPHMLAAKIRELIRFEESKGCRPEIADLPVPLEPPFQPIVALDELESPSSRPSAISAEADLGRWRK